jgi:histidinol-phosphate aminotransferase
MGGVAAALGYLGLKPGSDLWAAESLGRYAFSGFEGPEEDYDAMAKLGNNENPWGPPPAVMKAMTKAFKYSMRYGYPDGDITDAIAAHHGVQRENVLMAAGSGEILKIVGVTFLEDGKKVVGPEPSYEQVYSHASGIRADAIKLPLLDDFRQDMPLMIKTTLRNYRQVGFVYLCNPNNPTGRIVTKQEVKQLLDAIPEDMPVLIDEAYHHYVDDPNYATSVPYVLEGRQVVIARTFSKIYGMAGMRLGYAIAPRELIQRMRPHATGTINALVKWGGVAALADTETPARVKRETIEIRNRTTTALEGMGHKVIPSDANFFMVHIRRPVQPVIEEFRKRGVIVGRPFPPMTDYLRVSIGTPEEMDRFMTAWKGVFAGTTSAVGGTNGKR